MKIFQMETGVFDLIRKRGNLFHRIYNTIFLFALIVLLVFGVSTVLQAEDNKYGRELDVLFNKKCEPFQLDQQSLNQIKHLSEQNQVIVFGEVHARWAAPCVFTELVNYLAKHTEVTVALELPANEQYLIEPQGKQDKRLLLSKILSSKHWKGLDNNFPSGKPRTDGRASVAWAGILHNLISTKQTNNVEVAFILGSGQPRLKGKEMAENVLHLSKNRDHIILVLVGNFWSRAGISRAHGVINPEASLCERLIVNQEPKTVCGNIVKCGHFGSECPDNWQYRDQQDVFDSWNGFYYNFHIMGKINYASLPIYKSKVKHLKNLE